MSRGRPVSVQALNKHSRGHYDFTDPGASYLLALTDNHLIITFRQKLDELIIEATTAW